MTKEDFENYYKVKENFENDLSQRQKEIEKICDEYHYDMGIGGIDTTYIERDENLFYFGEHWHCMGEDGYEYSYVFPIECLWDDNALISFISSKTLNDKYKNGFKDMNYDID